MRGRKTKIQGLYQRPMTKVGIVGTTSWGTTLGVMLAERGIDVSLFARNEAEATKLTSDGENVRFLPGVKFPPTLKVTASAQNAFGDAGLVLFVVPSRTIRQNIERVRDSLNVDSVIVSAIKGIEIESGKRMSEILADELPEDFESSICALSGPNLAREIAQGKPSSTVVASSNSSAAEAAQRILNSSRFRVYTNDDIVGVELCGALKNIIALGAGICDGLDFGDNTKAAFITRGLAEISRLVLAAGGNPRTVAGLAGMGDLIATCASSLSRNHQVGFRIAEGKTLSEIQASMDSVAEGVHTTPAAVSLAKTLGVDMPIAQATYDVLFSGVSLDHAISALLGREPRPE